ncbi:hypothetical protein NDR87_26190 [Nocardia sp. CDC159]|uniref:Uncharacterized protein n=1 Tax=Nocardia pulmonis TaxID=2951408 RepID=A0A9X2IWH4_9NOCA|nr:MULTISPECIES: hypothetical protein [Nocardia]MCM6774937.1 hypothetical protein [Nocardia pulmonis]MCM6789868.1 hypothetical protein [Nocardia sp. CDC159]
MTQGHWRINDPGDRRELREWLVASEGEEGLSPQNSVQLLDLVDELAARLDALHAYGEFLTNPYVPILEQWGIGNIVQHLAAPERHPCPGSAPTAASGLSEGSAPQ